MKPIADTSAQDSYSWATFDLISKVPTVQDSPYKRALVSHKRSTCTSSEEGSPTSVLSTSRTKSLLETSEKSLTSIKGRVDVSCDWSNNWAANFGLTAGAAAPVSWSDSKSDNMEDLSHDSEEESEPESAISLDSALNLDNPEMEAEEPNLSAKCEDFANLPLLPKPLSSEPSLLGNPPVIPPPNLPLLSTPVRKSFTPNYFANSFVPSSSPEFSSPASAEVKKTPATGSKESGTGVFLPMKFSSATKGKKTSEENVTTVLLPSRLVETLGIKIDPETAAVIPKFTSKKQGSQRKIVRQYKYECRRLSPENLNERLWNPVDDFSPVSLLPIFIPMPVHVPVAAPAPVSPPVVKETKAPTPEKAPLVTYTLVDRSDEYPNLPDEWVY